MDAISECEQVVRHKGQKVKNTRHRIQSGALVAILDERSQKQMTPIVKKATSV